MIGVAVKAAKSGGRTAGMGLLSRPSFLSALPSSFRLLSGNNDHGSNPVTIQMINYGLSHARTHKSDESYAQGLLVLEQCLSAPTSDMDNSSALALLAMSSLLSERGNFCEAIDKLQKIQDLTRSSLGVRVAAMEALIGLHLELGQDDSSSELAEKCLQLVGNNAPEIDSEDESEIASTRGKAVKGLVELVRGNLESAESFFPISMNEKGCFGNAALSYGEFFHAKQDLVVAKELYKKVVQEMTDKKEFSDSACNMASQEALLAATCALGQLEAQSGNFGDAEEILTKALTEAEECFGSHHPKVGVVLTCIALMFRRKAMAERSSSLLIQEGLYRRAIDLLKAPPIDAEVAEAKVERRDVVALARGGYGEALIVQQNRKDEGEKMKRWAEAAWRNRRLSLTEALEISDPSSKLPVIDTRICRTL